MDVTNNTLLKLIIDQDYDNTLAKQPINTRVQGERSPIAHDELDEGVPYRIENEDDLLAHATHPKYMIPAAVERVHKDQAVIYLCG